MPAHARGSRGCAPRTRSPLPIRPGAARASSRRPRRRALPRVSQPPRASKLGDVPRARPDVAGGRANEAAGLLLLDDVRRPARDARTPEHGRRQVGRDLRDVEDDRGPELDVRLERAVRGLLAQRRERGLLERGRHLDARRSELLRCTAEDAGARILGAIYAVAEAHDALAALEELADVPLGI